MNFFTAFEQNQWSERVLIMVFLIIALAIGTRHAKANYEKLMKKLKTVADHFGLKFITPQQAQMPHPASNFASGLMAMAMKHTWAIEGKYQNVNFIITPEQKTVGSGRRRHKVTYTQICASFPEPLKAGLNIYREGFLSKIGKMLGSKDIQTGNPDFDKKFMIKGENESLLVPLLSSPTIQQAIIALFDSGNAVEIDDEGVTMECSGIVQTIEDYEPRLRLMADTVKSFTK